MFQRIVTCSEGHICPINEMASRKILGCNSCPELGCSLQLLKDANEKINVWTFEQRAERCSAHVADSDSDVEVCLSNFQNQNFQEFCVLLFQDDLDDDYYTPSPYEKFQVYFIQNLKLLPQRKTSTQHPLVTDLLDSVFRKNGQFFHCFVCTSCSQSTL